MDDLFLTTPSVDGEMLNTWKRLGLYPFKKLNRNQAHS